MNDPDYGSHPSPRERIVNMDDKTYTVALDRQKGNQVVMACTSCSWAYRLKTTDPVSYIESAIYRHESSGCRK